MRILNLAVAAACAAFVASPAYSQVKKTDSRQYREATVDGVTFNADNPADTSKLKLNKKAYMEQIEQSFDKMDINHDGVIDSAEIARGRRGGQDATAEEEQDYTNNERLQRSMPSRTGGTVSKATTNNGVSPAKSIPPVNSGDLIKR